MIVLLATLPLYLDQLAQPIVEVGAEIAVARDDVRGAQTVAPHDQRVFVVIAVVPAADALVVEAILAVQLLGWKIRDPNLQRRTPSTNLARDLEQSCEEHLAQSLAPQLGLD